MKHERITSEDLHLINEAKANKAFSKVLREKHEAQTAQAVAEENVANLQHHNILLTTFLKYGLTTQCSIDASGKITYPAEPESVEYLEQLIVAPPVAPKPKKTKEPK